MTAIVVAFVAVIMTCVVIFGVGATVIIVVRVRLLLLILML